MHRQLMLSYISSNSIKCTIISPWIDLQVSRRDHCCWSTNHQQRMQPRTDFLHVFNVNSNLKSLFISFCLWYMHLLRQFCYIFWASHPHCFLICQVTHARYELCNEGSRVFLQGNIFTDKVWSLERKYFLG